MMDELTAILRIADIVTGINWKEVNKCLREYQEYKNIATVKQCREAVEIKNCAGCSHFDIENRLCKNYDSPTTGRVIDNIEFYCSDYDGEGRES